VSEWEEEMACAQGKDLPTALILFSVIEDGGEHGLCCRIPGGKG